VWFRLEEPPVLAPRLCLCAALSAVAGSAAAQGNAGMMAPMPDYRPNTPALLDQPLGPDAHACVDGKLRDGPAPKVVRIMPAPGSVVRPGPMVLSVTFDRPMACAAVRKASPFPIPCPGEGDAVLFSPDRRTLTTVCVVEAGASYSMPLVDFVGDGGAKSERYDLAFTTSTSAPVRDARQALALEKTGPAQH
jgi:hypothetical protein